MSEQVEVVIKGQDQLTPAVKTAEASLQQLVQAGKQSAIEVVALDSAFQQLRTEFNVGKINSIQYAQALRTMRADLAGLASAAGTGAVEMRALEQTSRLVRNEMQMAQSINQRFASGITRTAFGVQALTMSMNAGRISATGLSAALLTMSSSNPAMMAVIAGLAALVGIYASIRAATKDATKAAEEFQAVQLNLITSGAFMRWMRAAETAFAARGTEDFQRLAAEAEMYGRRYGDAVREVQRIREAGFHEGGAGQGRGARGGAGGGREQGFAWRGMAKPKLGAGAPFMDKGQMPALPTMEGFDALAGAADRAFAGMQTDALNAADAMLPLANSVGQLNQALLVTGDLASAAFAGLLEGLMTGHVSISQITRSILRELAMEAKAKAVFELAEGFAALANPFKASFAPIHFRSAALYGAAAVAAGVAAGGVGAGAGGQGGGGGGFARDAGRATSAATTTYTTIIQFVTEDGRVLGQAVARSNARAQNLGAALPGVQTQRLAVPGLVVVTGG